VGLDQVPPALDDALARVHEHDDDHRSHRCANDDAQRGSCAGRFCDGASDDPGESGVECTEVDRLGITLPRPSPLFQELNAKGGEADGSIRVNFAG
jgi:hypothetical protein